MRITTVGAVALLLTVGPMGCKKGEDGIVWDDQCAEHAPSCAGVPEGTLGSGPYFTEGAVCSRVWYVQEGATGGNGDETAPMGDLPDAADVAADGDCIALAAGSYSGATVGGGVSVLGRGAGATTISASDTAVLALVNGSGAMIRGVGLTGGLVGLYTSDASELTVESVLVDAVKRIGVQLVGGANVTLRQVRIANIAINGSESAGVGLTSIGVQGLGLEAILVEDNPGSGVLVRDGDLSITDSVIRNNDGYGIAVSCPDCLEVRPQVILHNNLVQGNELVGIWMMLVDAQVSGNIIADTRNGQPAGGFPPTSRQIEANQVGQLELLDNTLDLGEDIGVLLHESSGELSGNIITNHGGRGVWVQNTAGIVLSALQLIDNEVVGNAEVSVGVKGDCDIVIDGGVISDTQDKPIFVEGQSAVVGDGVQALTDTLLSVDGVYFDGNGRSSILVDGALDANVTNSVFGVSDVDAIVIQNVGWDPSSLIIGNESIEGLDVGFTQFSSPADFISWDPFDMPAGSDPLNSVVQ